MAYTKQTWQDGNSSYPLSATRMNYIETGIKDAHDLIALGGGGGGGGGDAALVVASNDAPTAVKASASYVCNGSDDQVEIQAAIDAAAPLQSRNSDMPVGATQLGRVILTGGRFIITAPIQMRTAVSLMGSGWATELLSSGNTGTGVIRLAAPNDHVVHVQDLQLNGNSSSGGTCNGIDFDMTGSGDTGGYPGVNPDSYHYISNLLVKGFSNGTRTGIKLWASGTANNRGNIITDCQIRDCSANGIWLTASSDSFINTCHIGGSDSAGIRIETGNTKIVNCKTFYSDQYGFYIASGRHTIANCESQDDQVGFWLAGADSVYSALVADTCAADGIVIAANGTVLNGFQSFLRSGGRYTTMANGLRYTASQTDLSIVGRVRPDSITTPISGTPGARSFVRVSNGTTLVSAG